jgi:hypothetical protein
MALFAFIRRCQVATSAAVVFGRLSLGAFLENAQLGMLLGIPSRKFSDSILVVS